MGNKMAEVPPAEDQTTEAPPPALAAEAPPAEAPPEEAPPAEDQPAEASPPALAAVAPPVEASPATAGAEEPAGSLPAEAPPAEAGAEEAHKTVSLTVEARPAEAYQTYWAPLGAQEPEEAYIDLPCGILIAPTMDVGTMVWCECCELWIRTTMWPDHRIYKRHRDLAFLKGRKDLL